MFTISHAQIDVLKQRGETRFVESLCSMLAQRFAGLLNSDAGRRDFASQGIAQGRRRGLSSREDLRSWVQLRATHGPDFDRQPWAAPVLADRGLTPSEQLSLLVERAVFLQLAAASAAATGGTARGRPPRR